LRNIKWCETCLEDGVGHFDAVEFPGKKQTLEFPVDSCFMCVKAPVTAAMHRDMIIRPLCSTRYSVEAKYNASWGWGVEYTFITLVRH